MRRYVIARPKRSRVGVWRRSEAGTFVNPCGGSRSDVGVAIWLTENPSFPNEQAMLVAT
jgi:hypothetical protein